MKLFGFMLVLVAGMIMSVNVYRNHQNQKEIENHPVKTVLSMGENLKPAYTFTAPYSNFEITVMGTLVLGFIFMMIGGSNHKY